MSWSDDPLRDAYAYWDDLERREMEYKRHNATCPMCLDIIDEDEAVVLDPLNAMEDLLCLRCADKVVFTLRKAGLDAAGDLLEDLFTHSTVKTPNELD